MYQGEKAGTIDYHPSIELKNFYYGSDTRYKNIFSCLDSGNKDKTMNCMEPVYRD